MTLFVVDWEFIYMRVFIITRVTGEIVHIAVFKSSLV